MNRNRKSPRLKDYDYAQEGAYFVTICTHQRKQLFGHVDTDGKMQLSEWGKIAEERWADIPSHFPHIELDLFVIMPNHMHGIVLLSEVPTKSTKSSVGERHANVHQVKPQ